MAKLEKDWDKPLSEPVGLKIKDSMFPGPPLKQRINQIIHRLNIQSSRLNVLLERLKEKDKRLFEKVIDSYLKHEVDRAKVFANEVANTRKTIRLVDGCKTALESVALRLETIQSIGDVAVTVSGAISVIQSIRGKLGGILPELDKELLAVNENLTGLLYETEGPSGMIGGYNVTSEEAESILKEAMSVAESRTKERLPEIPLGSNTTLTNKE
jgi:division protein CdvB (Snf7/Vps24/ESCRT-III family)